MKKCLITSLVLFILASNAYSLSIENIIGCYKTLRINGKEVEPGPRPELSQTEFFVTENKYFRDLEKKRPLMSLVLSFYRGHRGPYHSFSNAIAFTDQGEWHESGSQLDYFFDFDVIYRNKNYQMLKIDHKVDFTINHTKTNILEGSIDYQSDARNIGDSFSFTLEKTTCL